MDNIVPGNGLPQGWRIARFDEFLKRVERKFFLDDATSYPCVGVRWYGHGAFIRNRLLGMDIKRKQQWIIKSGDILYNKLFAWKGAFAIADSSVDDCIVSDKFPTYEADHSQIDPNFLAYYFLTPRVSQQAEVLSKGAAAISKLTLNPPQFWELTIPLPPLSEQRRIMTHVEELAARIEEARGLRHKAMGELDLLVSSLHLKLAGTRTITIKDFLALDEEREEVRFGRLYPQVGVKGFGQGLFPRETLDASQTTYKSFNTLYDGAVVLSQVKGWEGAIAVCPSNLVGRFVSPEYRTFRCMNGEAVPEYLAKLVATPWFWTQLKNLTRGVGARRERTRPEQFLQMKLPMPEVEQQKRAIAIFERLDSLKPLQTDTADELDALLPSVLDKAFRGEL